MEIVSDFAFGTENFWESFRILRPRQKTLEIVKDFARTTVVRGDPQFEKLSNMLYCENNGTYKLAFFGPRWTGGQDLPQDASAYVLVPMPMLMPVDPTEQLLAARAAIR